MIHPFRNLRKYEDSSLNEIKVEDRAYLTSTDYAPALALGLAFGNEHAICTQRLGVAIRDAQAFFETGFPAIGQMAVLKNCDFPEGSDFWSIDSWHYGKDPRDLSYEAPLDTHQALEIAMDIANRQKLNHQRSLYIAHPAHMERVIAVAEKVGFKGEPFVEREVVWNDVDDSTQSSNRWAKREMMVRMHHILKGYV